MNKELESFSHSVSHDLRTPLRFVNRIAHLLLQESGAHFSKGATQQVNLILQATSEMAKLFENLLLFSQASRDPVKKQRVDLKRLVREDLALPGSDGFSVLGQIRSLDAGDALTLTPVVIFTDSQSAGDITKSYRCGANSYIMKPLSFPDFEAVVKTVGQYWMTHNRACI